MVQNYRFFGSNYRFFGQGYVWEALILCGFAGFQKSVSIISIYNGLLRSLASSGAVAYKERSSQTAFPLLAAIRAAARVARPGVMGPHIKRGLVARVNSSNSGAIFEKGGTALQPFLSVLYGAAAQSYGVCQPAFQNLP